MAADPLSRVFSAMAEPTRRLRPGQAGLHLGVDVDPAPGRAGRAWSQSRARAGVALIVPTRWQDECCYRICVVNPLTTDAMLAALLDDMSTFP